MPVRKCERWTPNGHIRKYVSTNVSTRIPEVVNGVQKSMHYSNPSCDTDLFNVSPFHLKKLSSEHVVDKNRTTTKESCFLNRPAIVLNIIYRMEQKGNNTYDC